jgi:two-component system chemotaxis response regulator CheY
MAPPPREPDFGKLTILVVEDQEYIRKLIQQLLTRLGCGAVMEARDGSEGLQALSVQNPDLVLCDIKMQPVDGLEFLRRVRSGENVRDRTVPIVFLTSDSDRATVVAAIESEVDGYLVKPVSPQDLRSKIIAVLSKRMAARGIRWGG